MFPENFKKATLLSSQQKRGMASTLYHTSPSPRILYFVNIPPTYHIHHVCPYGAIEKSPNQILCLTPTWTKTVVPVVKSHVCSFLSNNPPTFVVRHHECHGCMQLLTDRKQSCDSPGAVEVFLVLTRLNSVYEVIFFENEEG